MNEIKRIDPFVITGPDFCPMCMKQHVVDVYTVYDKPIGLTGLLNYKKNIGESINVPLKYGRCRNCGARFKIIWDNGNIRFSNDKYMTRDFVSQFKDFDMGDVEDAYFDASSERIFRD